MYNGTIHNMMGVSMKASVVDLRYRMKDVLKALDRNESVDVLHYGRKRGTIVPYKVDRKRSSVKEHEFFGFSHNDAASVEEKMDQLRGGRYRDL